MKNKAIRLGAAGALAALAVSAVGIPAQAADAQPSKPGIATEAVALKTLVAPVGVDLNRGLSVGMQAFISYGNPNRVQTTAEYQWLRNGVVVPGATGYGYTVLAADVGKKISYRVTLTSPGYRPLTVTSPSSDTILPSSPAPVVTGTALPGNTLTGTQKEPWAMSGPVTMKYQWLRNGTPIPGAAALTYKLTNADLNALIVLRAQGVNAGKVLASSYSLPVKPSTLKKLTISPQYLDGDPRNPKWGPYAMGNPRATDSMVLSPAVWKETGVKSSVQWLRDGAVIPGATGAIYTFTSADVGARVTVIITGSKKGYADTIVTAETFGATVRTAPVAGSTPIITGNATVGSVLTASWKTEPKAKFSWFRNGRAIDGATGPTYKLTGADKGALIAAYAQRQAMYPGYSVAVIAR